MYFSENQIFPTGFLMSAYLLLRNKSEFYIIDFNIFQLFSSH